MARLEYESGFEEEIDDDRCIDAVLFFYWGGIFYEAKVLFLDGYFLFYSAKVWIF